MSTPCLNESVSFGENIFKKCWMLNKILHFRRFIGMVRVQCIPYRFSPLNNIFKFVHGNLHPLNGWGAWRGTACSDAMYHIYVHVCVCVRARVQKACIWMCSLSDGRTSLILWCCLYARFARDGSFTIQQQCAWLQHSSTNSLWVAYHGR